MNLRAFLSILERDLRITARNRMELCLPLVFYVLVIALVPLAISPNTNTLATIAPVPPCWQPCCHWIDCSEQTLMTALWSYYCSHRCPCRCLSVQKFSLTG